MKKHMTLFALFSGILLSSAIGNTQTYPDHIDIINIESDEIDLRGRIEPGEIRREIKAISAFIEENTIRAQFHYDLGAVQITITNGSGISVYSSTIASSIGEVYIPITGLTAGNYTITFTASAGVLSGDFAL
jgi:hypothetical protein